MLPTVTIVSTRAVSMFGMELTVASIVVVAVIAWMTLTHVRHHRNR